MLVVKTNKVDTSTLEEAVYELKEMMAGMSSGGPVEIRAPSPGGPKVTQADIDRWNALGDKTATLEGAVEKLMKETKDLDRIREMLKEIRSKLSDFVLKEDFLPMVNDVRNLKEDVAVNREDLAALAAEVEKIKDQLARMDFPSKGDFDLLRGRVDSLENALSSLRKAVGDIEKKLKGLIAGGGGAD